MEMGMGFHTMGMHVRYNSFDVRRLFSIYIIDVTMIAYEYPGRSRS